MPIPGAPTLPADVAVIGGGASGLLTAVALLEASPDPTFRVALHEAGGVLGRGVAYGTTDERHLLNVRARHMSAYRDKPSDLLDWASRTGRDVDPLAFLPRMTYADYLRDTLSDHADGRLEVHGTRVEDVVPVDGGFKIHAGDTVSRARAVVLAYGNLAPRALSVDGTDLPDAPWHLPNAWDVARLTSLPADATVVLVGSGLTAVDAAITLLCDEPARTAVMTSRHGLLPSAHVEQQSTAWVSPVPGGPLTAQDLADLVRDQVDAARRHGVGWRAVVDGLRAPTQGLWMRLDLDERRRFLAEHARHWEVRRHRMATEVAARIEGYRTEGRLDLHAGGIAALQPVGDRVEVTLATGGPRITADAIVNCTGPLTDVSLSADPLLVALRERGLVGPDPLALGLACTPEGAVIDTTGDVVPGLWAVGPPRKGTLYESTAVPEIRTQAAELAGTLTRQAAYR